MFKLYDEYDMDLEKIKHQIPRSHKRQAKVETSAFPAQSELKISARRSVFMSMSLSVPLRGSLLLVTCDS